MEDGGDIYFRIGGGVTNPANITWVTASGSGVSLGGGSGVVAGRLNLKPLTNNTERFYIGSSSYRFTYIGEYVTSGWGVSVDKGLTSNYCSMTLKNVTAMLDCWSVVGQDSTFIQHGVHIRLGSLPAIYPGGLASPNTNHDIGLLTDGWDNVYASNYDNPLDMYYLDTYDDLEVINNIKPSGEIHEKTGLPLIDDRTLPEWMFTKAAYDFEYHRPVTDVITGSLHKRRKKGTVAYTPTGKPWVSLILLDSLAFGGIRALDRKVEDLNKRLNDIEEKE
jgi:hypothetical protein